LARSRASTIERRVASRPDRWALPVPPTREAGRHRGQAVAKLSQVGPRPCPPSAKRREVAFELGDLRDDQRFGRVEAVEPLVERPDDRADHGGQILLDRGGIGQRGEIDAVGAGPVPFVEREAQGGLGPGKVDDRVESWVSMTSNVGDLPYTQLGDGSSNVLQVHFNPNGTNDEWHFNSITLVGRPAGGTGPDTCLARWEWDENAPTPYVMNSGTPDVFFQKGGACK